MPNTINAQVSPVAGLVSSADGSGVLNLQTNSTTAISIDTSQKVILSLNPTVNMQAVTKQYVDNSNKVLQKIYVYDAGSTISYTGGVYTNLNAAYINITPKSTNSKIIVEVSYDAKMDCPFNPPNFLTNTFIAESTVILSTTLRTFATGQPVGTPPVLYCTGSQAGVFNNTALTTRGFHLVGTTQADVTFGALYMNWIITEVAN